MVLVVFKMHYIVAEIKLGDILLLQRPSLETFCCCRDQAWRHFVVAEIKLGEILFLQRSSLETR